jgi:hypothetical protein
MYNQKCTEWKPPSPWPFGVISAQVIWEKKEKRGREKRENQGRQSRKEKIIRETDGKIKTKGAKLAKRVVLRE